MTLVTKSIKKKLFEIFDHIKYFKLYIKLSVMRQTKSEDLMCNMVTIDDNTVCIVQLKFAKNRT